MVCIAMSNTTIIAIYAALIATASVAWQIYVWRHRQKTHVEVVVRMALSSPAPGVTQYALTVTAINRSEHAVRVTGVGVDLPNGLQYHQLESGQGDASLPGPIPSHDSAFAMLMREDVEREGLDVYEPITGWVRLSTGKIVTSSPTQVLALS
jgi:hypothetical protein